MKIGLIAEETSDYEVLYALTCKLVSEELFSYKKFIGHGHSKIHRKCTAWAEILIRGGCSHLVVLHDLDRNNEASLNDKLSNMVSDVGFEGYLILIPVEEIEAWLMADARALKKVFGLAREPKLPKNPESISDPKEKLRGIIWKSGRKKYVNTFHNKKIAEACDVKRLNKCNSFRPFPQFITSIFS